MDGVTTREAASPVGGEQRSSEKARSFTTTGGPRDPRELDPQRVGSPLLKLIVDVDGVLTIEETCGGWDEWDGAVPWGDACNVSMSAGATRASRAFKQQHHQQHQHDVLLMLLLNLLLFQEMHIIRGPVAHGGRELDYKRE